MLPDLIPELGLFCLILSLVFSILLSINPILSPQKINPTSFALGQMTFVTLSFLALAWAFYTDDWSVQYVAHNSNARLPIPYKLSAIWGGHEGSMLLWYAILCFWTCLFSLSLNSQEKTPEISKIKSFACMVLGLLGVGFNLFILITSNPFARYLPEVPIEGADLNPLLQDFALIIHPPILYLGYVGFAIPFALSIAALLSNNSVTVIKLMRPWVLAAWSFLTLGIALGSWWAYYELGWGGWWFWDPVENASVMPWVAGIALLHMIKVTNKTQALGRWTLFLALVCFSFSLLGTYLVRSGVLSSVHSFAADPRRGRFLLYLLAFSLGGTGFIYAFRARFTQTKPVLLFSRENTIFGGSIILFVFTVSILLGTLYPMIMDALFHTPLSVGPPYFNNILIPFITVLLFIMGLSPHIKWLKDRPVYYFKFIFSCFFISLILSLLIPTLFKIALSFKLILGLFLGFWIIVTTAVLFYKRFKNKNIINQSFISMAIAHLGVALCVMGVTLTTHLDIEKDIPMQVGTKIRVGDYQFYLKSLKEVMGPNYQGMRGEMEIRDKLGNIIKILYPEKRFYIPREIPVSETAIDPGFFRDLYVALAEPLSEDVWSVRIQVKPFVRWIWLGALLMAVGGFCAGFRTSSLRAPARRSFSEGEKRSNPATIAR